MTTRTKRRWKVEKVEELLLAAEAALGAEPVAGEPMYQIQQRSLLAERLDVKALIAAVQEIASR